MLQLPAALRALSAWPQFITWKARPNPSKPGKFEKFPCYWQTGVIADSQNPANWATFEVAAAWAALADEGHGSGVGFVITERDPFFFLDIDGAWDDRTGQWSTIAQQLCAQLAGCAVELSMSRTGLHIFGHTSKPLAHARKNTPLNLELYTSKRFVALTGDQASGDIETVATDALAPIIAAYFQPTVHGDSSNWSSVPVPEYTGPADDEELIAKAMRTKTLSAAAAFGGNISTNFEQLWTADVEALSRAYPPKGHASGYDQSAADQALANQLAFWTGKNCERMRTLMERSALNREKWHVRGEYLPNTIAAACAFIKKVYTHDITPAEILPDVADAQAAGAKMRDPDAVFMSPVTQLEHFKGCFYDRSTGMVYSVPHNRVFNKSTFDVEYGGHLFVLDHRGEKKTPSAWEALTLSFVNPPPLVDGLVFRPELERGEKVREGDQVYLNSYAPHTPREEEGSPALFLQHVAKLLPDEADRAKLLGYMAACAQYPGRKFKWWPVVQGVQGNGKSLLIGVMTYILGSQYVHLPNMAKMASKGSSFNGWLYRKLFLGLEEMMAAHRRDLLEELKPMVTEDRLEMESKGANQFMADNRANGMILTNHKNGVPVDADTRRYAVFFTAQQTPEDLARDGMGSDYFEELFDWLKGERAYAKYGKDYGYACVCRFLKSTQIDADIMQSLMYRAPATTSTEMARFLSMGALEQLIVDACEEGRVGFAGGWISGHWLDQLVQAEKQKISLHTRDEVLKRLGYIVHPSLPKGRVNNIVQPDGKRAKLYVRKDHVSLELTEPAAVANAYSRAQGVLDGPVNRSRMGG